MLFCPLTSVQQQVYESFLKSQEVQQVLAGKRHLLYAIDIMRKICNHPDLLTQDVAKRVGGLLLTLLLILYTYIYTMCEFSQVIMATGNGLGS